YPPTSQHHTLSLHDALPIYLYNSEIIAYSLSQSPTVKFTNQSLEDALTKLPEQHDLTVHTDQGFHYQHWSWVKLLEENNICQSIDRKSTRLNYSHVSISYAV